MNGRVQSGTDALGQARTYTYDLIKNSMTVTFPPDGSGNIGSETSVDDSYGMMLSYTNPLGFGVPGGFCTSFNETNWYERSLEWHEERSTHRSKS